MSTNSSESNAVDACRGLADEVRELARLNGRPYYLIRSPRTGDVVSYTPSARSAEAWAAYSFEVERVDPEGP